MTMCKGDVEAIGIVDTRMFGVCTNLMRKMSKWQTYLCAGQKHEICIVATQYLRDHHFFEQEQDRRP